MAVADPQGGVSRSWRLGIFLNVVLICVVGAVVAAGVVAVVRELSFKRDLRLDLTRDARYELDPTAERVLRSLESPVEIHFVWGIDPDIEARVRDPYGQPRADLLRAYYMPLLGDIARRVTAVLAEWEKVSPYVRGRTIFAGSDPRAVQNLATELGRKQEQVINRVILVSGRRRREVPLRRMADISWGYFSPNVASRAPDPPYVRGSWRVQAELTAALRALSAGEVAPVGIVVGKDSRYELDDPATFTAVNEVLTAEGYRPEPLEIEKVEEIPTQLRAVLLLGLQSRLGERALGLLQRYEAAGGRLFILADPRHPEDYRALLEPYGYSLMSGIVEDTSNTIPQRPGRGEIDSRDLCVGRHPIERPLAKRVNIYLGPSRAFATSPDRAPGAERRTLLQGSAGASLIPVEFDAGTGEGRFILGGKRPLPRPPLAVAFRRPASMGGAESRLVVFGSSALLQAYELGLATQWGNRDLFTNSLNWLTEREAQIGIITPDEIRSEIESYEQLAGPFLWIAVIGLPLLAALVGLVVYFTRRT